MSRDKKLRLAASCAVGLLFAQQGFAATAYDWTTAANGNWNDAANWTPNSGFPAAGDSATFNASGANGDEIIYLNGSQSTGSLTFNNTGATTIVGGTSGTPDSTQLVTLSGSITVNSGAGAVTFGTVTPVNTNTGLGLSGTVTLTNNSTNTFQVGTVVAATAIRGVTAGTNTLVLDGTGTGIIGGVILNSAGTTAVTKNGTGFWELQGNSSYTGPVILNNGTLSIKSANALGTATKTFTINGGTFANNGARNLPAAISVSINADVGFGTGTNGGSAPTFSGVVTLSAGNHNFTCNNSTAFLGQITGTGGITKVDSQIIGNNPTTLTLASTNNNYSGSTTILAGILTLGTASIGGSCYPAASPLILAGGTTLNAQNTGSMSVASLSDYQGAGGNINMGNVGADQWTVGSDNTTTTFSGTFSGLDPNKTGGLTKVGTGTLYLRGASTFNGYIRASEGLIAFNTIGNIGATNSNLFAPVDAPFGTINLGATTFTGGLQFAGSASQSSDRILNLAGTTGGGTLDASGVGAATITYTSNLTATGAGAKTLFLTGTNAGANTIQGIIPDSTSATSLQKDGTGTWVLTAANSYTGSTTVNAGTLVLDNNLTASSSVSVAGGTLQLASNGTQNRYIKTPTVAAPGGKLDLVDNKMIITTAGSRSSVNALVAAGFNGGTWNAAGIVTSQTAALSSTPLTTLAVAQASDVGYGGTVTFGGVSVSGTDTLVMYTYAGDTTLDGQITGDDYFRIDNGYTSNGALTGYENGDLNYDGSINADDYFIIDKNYGNQSLGQFAHAPGVGGLSAVPEPASLGLLGVAATGLLRRRRRQM